ncbi:acyltransferase family protein [Ramlibacter sp. PS4R-6]|uniref:acyltransferase family protein n=1 Tax=Ramlibacter sp. PS4R-6 TaxID=3133438 RepID=UPI0030AD88FA
MGSLRLVLATLVLLSHAGVRLHGLNPGVVAVVVFYLISGYVMAGLIHKHYDSPGGIPGFYADRALRIFPQYLFYMLAALAWHLATGTQTLFLTRTPTAQDLFNNFTVIPLNFFMFNGADGYSLVPPAWSLGAELQFYLLAPVMLLWPRIGLVLAAISVGVQVMAMHGVLNTDWYGYRLLAGVLWFFAAGMLMFHLKPRAGAILAVLAPVLAAAAWLYLRARHLDGLTYNTEVLIGWGAGIPLVWLLGRRRSGKFDRLAGDVSYGMFLNHFLLIWLLFPASGLGAAQLAALAVCSFALSWATQRALERPVLAWRRRLRARTDGTSVT